jgi:multidrug resistance efflux pump
VKKWIVGIVILTVLGIVAYVVVSPDGINAASDSPMADATEIPPVKAGNEVVADAVVVPVRSAELSLSAGGIVAQVLVSEGEQVEAGEVLLRLEAARQEAALLGAEAQLCRAQSALAEMEAGPRAEEIEAARAALKAAQAQLARVQQGARPEEVAVAEAGLAAAQASLQKLREDPSEGQLVAARADVANAEAALRQAQAVYDRVKHEANIAARPEALALEQATNAYDAAQARLDALQEGATPADLAAVRAQIDQALAQLAAVQAPARTAEIAAAEAEIERAQAQLDLLLAGTRPEAIAALEADVAAAEAGVQQARVALAETELRVPFAGTVALLSAKVGEQVAPGSPLVILADLSAWQLETEDLTEIHVVRVREGDPVSIAFDAIPDLELPGRVVRVQAIGEDKMGDITYTAIIEPEQHDGRLRWNMTASVVIDPR